MVVASSAFLCICFTLFGMGLQTPDVDESGELKDFSIVMGADGIGFVTGGEITLGSGMTIGIGEETGFETEGETNLG